MAVRDDPLHVVVPDRIEACEQRRHALGMVGAVAILVVVHTNPDPEDDCIIRIIGAWRATIQGRRRYEQDSAQRGGTGAVGRARGPAGSRDRYGRYPEAPAENCRDARRGLGHSPVERSATIPIDGDVVSWFKRHASDDGYQAEINRVLRRYVDEAVKRSG